MRGTTAVLRVKVASSYPATRRSPIMSPSWPHLTICLSSEHVYSSPPAQAHALHLKMGRQSTRRVKEGKPVKRTRVKNERVGRGCRRDSSGVGETGQAHMSLCPLAFSETSSRILADRQLTLRSSLFALGKPQQPPPCLLSAGNISGRSSPHSTSARLPLRSGGITSRFAVGQASGRDDQRPPPLCCI